VRKVLLLASLAVFLSFAGCFKRGPELVQTPLSISISTNISLVGIGQSATITAIVYDQNSQGVQWSASPLNFGTLSNSTYDPSTLTATVTYTAPPVAANSSKVTVTANSITNPSISASISFNFSPITISLQNNLVGVPLAPLTTLNPYNRIQLFAAVLNDPSNLGVIYSLSPPNGAGSLTVLDNFTSLYTAPTVSAATTIIVTATSVKDPAVTASQTLAVLPSGAGPNVVMLNVNGGPVPGQVYSNRAFTSILLCNPGSITTCQTIDGILVDTGSYGLRILDSEIPLLNLPRISDPAGNILESCASWPDGSFLWGPVATADFYIGGEAATLQLGGVRSAVIQVISSAAAPVPESCTNGATASDNTPELLGANGILGIGPEPTDCTLSGVNYCDGSTQSTPPNVYYACPNTGCTTQDSPVLVNALQQISNPIPLFSTDNNGVIIQLPAVSDPQASTLGTMTFGIGTESNNSLGSATVLTLDANDYFTTIFNGQLLTNSYVDSGSNGLFFPDSLPPCSVNQEFYCPTSPVTLSATNVGYTQGQSTVNFTVEDADSLLLTFSQDSVFPTFAGPSPNRGACAVPSALCVFDWGLPFFYGRNVYVAIDGETVFNAPASPWLAY